VAKTPERKAEENKPPPSQENEENLTPFERMRRFTKAVVNVRKDEIDKARLNNRDQH
jgi:hypothetical protein